MLEAERTIREYLQNRNGGDGDVRVILDAVVELAQADKLAYEKLRNQIAKTCGIRVSILDAEIFPESGQNKTAAGVVFSDPQPSRDPVNGAVLLDEISEWLSRYVVLPPGAADAVAVWTVASWFVDHLYFAPLLVLLSPTKRAGKTLLLDMLRHIVRRGQPTSGIGITPAVLFRLNDEWCPTFLIDEAEKLAGMREGALEVIGLLNSGYRRGGHVQRCTGDDHHVENYDSFGFRVVAAIGRLWDTLLDRSITVHMQRKSSAETVERFQARNVESEGQTLAAKIARWAQDHVEEIADAEADAPRPAWMHDRSCDNWSPLFAVADLAGGGWVERLLESAGKLEGGKEEYDYGEKLILDIQGIFKEMGSPDVIPSGELVTSLKRIETSPWADLRGSGLTANKLARMLKKFEVKPKFQRDSTGSPVRGYWLRDLESVFSRYSPTESATTATPLINQQITATKCDTKEIASIALNGSKHLPVADVAVRSAAAAGKENGFGENPPCWSCLILQQDGDELARCASHKHQNEIPF